MPKRVYELPKGEKLKPGQEDAMQAYLEDDPDDPFAYDPSKGELWPLAEQVYGGQKPKG